MKLVTLVSLVAVASIASAQGTTAPATTATAPAAAATSTTTAAAPAAPAKAWSASIVSDTSADATNVKAVQSLTMVGGKIAVTDKMKLGATQVFETLSNAAAGADAAYVDQNNFRPAYTELKASISGPAMLGAQSSAFAIGERIYNQSAVMSRFGAASTINSFSVGSASLTYELNSKWSVEAYNELRVYNNETGPTTSRLAVTPSLNYAINDVLGVYQVAGIMVGAGVGPTVTKQRMYLETGVNITPAKGLGINLFVSQDKAVMSKKSSDVTAFDLYSSNGGHDDVGYEAVLSYAF